MPFTLPLGSKMPSFCLASTDGTVISSNMLTSPYLVVFFTCNHCPYVTGSDESTRKTALEFEDKGVQFIGINSNSPEHYEEDSFHYMVERMHKYTFPWLYLYDPTQEIAKTFGALKTPHFYIFNQERQLVYCGRGVDSPRDTSRITENNLRQALEELTSDQQITTPLTNPIGCNVKWKDQDVHWMPEEACDLV